MSTLFLIVDILNICDPVIEQTDHFVIYFPLYLQLHAYTQARTNAHIHTCTCAFSYTQSYTLTERET